MSLIKLDHGNIAVNPDHVECVKVNTEKDKIEIHMSNGTIHALNNEYRKTIWETFDAVLKTIGLAVT